MGYSISKKMMPIIIMKILGEHADENNMLTIEQIIHYVKEYLDYEDNLQLAKLIRTNIKQLNEFFEDTHFTLDGFNEVHIEGVSFGNSSQSRGYVRKYYLKGKLFTDTEVRLISDSILFSPGISGKEAEYLLVKIKKLASKHFGSWFEYVKYSDMVKRSDNSKLFNKLELAGRAMKQKRKITFRYRKSTDLPYREATVSPYYLVISSGRYYLLCNKDNKEDVSHYRLDKIEDMVIVESIPARKIETLKEIEHPFSFKKYMEEHPRMSFEKTVTATLIVSNYLVDAVQSEFKVKSIRKGPDDTTSRVRIVSTKTAICNWIINVTDQIQLERVSDTSIIDVLMKRATNIIEQYKQKD